MLCNNVWFVTITTKNEHVYLEYLMGVHACTAKNIQIISKSKFLINKCPKYSSKQSKFIPARVIMNVKRNNKYHGTVFSTQTIF